MKLLFVLCAVCYTNYIYSETLPFSDPIINIIGTAVGTSKKSDDLPYAKDIVQIVKDGINLGKKKKPTKKPKNDKSEESESSSEESSSEESDDLPYAKDIVQIVKDGINLGKKRKPTKKPNDKSEADQSEESDKDNDTTAIKSRRKRLPLQSKFYIHTTIKYETSKTGIASPISITELNLPVSCQTVRATYFLKIQTSHVWYAPSFGFKVPNSKDKLFGTVIWPTHKNGKGVTMYSLIPKYPRYYSLQEKNAVDSELVFDTRLFPSKDIFNTIRIDIEYIGTKSGQLILEMNRDLKGYTGHSLTVLPGSSVVYETY